MAAFALATSVTPGPVNVVALSAGARHGWRASLPYVFGATAGFTALLLLVGFALEQVVHALPRFALGVRWAGGAFLLYMAWRLAGDRGGLDVATRSRRRPSMLAGAAMQWLNPKAWFATLSGMAVYGIAQVGLFAAIYFAVCFASIAAWAVAGSTLATVLADGRTLRRLNVAMAALLAASAVVMLWA